MNSRLKNFKPLLKRLLFVPPIMLGCFAVYYALHIRKPPERVPEKELARALRVISVASMPVVPRAVGYGSAQPAREWAAVAEVKGRIMELHPDLDAGSFIKTDALLVRFDSADIQLAIDRLDAEIEKSEASLAELKAQEANYNQALKIEQQVLAVNEAELRREEELVKTGAGSTADVDSRKRSVIAERQAVQNILSSLNLLPSQIRTAAANIAVAKSNRAEKQRDLARCEIRAPFACRLGPVDLDVNEYMALGQQLFTAQSTDKIEVEAQFSTANVNRLVRPDSATGALRDELFGGGSIELTQDILRRLFDVSATVKYGPAKVSAKFERVREQLDAQTRTVGMVVSIADPYGPTARDNPPPVSGTYCEVELRAKAREDVTVIPRIALHTSHVFVLDAENRLRRREVVVGMMQGNLVVLSSGLELGEKLVVSDPTPAIEGMLVTPSEDADVVAALRQEAAGDGTQ